MPSPPQVRISVGTERSRIFKTGTRFDKEHSFYKGFPPLNGSLNQILETKPAMARINMISPYFSREAIRRAEPLISKCTVKFISVLSDAATSGKAVNLSFGFRCITADTIMNHSFQKPLGALDAPGFDFPLIMALDASLKDIQWVHYFPTPFMLLFRITDLLPETLFEMLFKPLYLTKWCLNVRYGITAWLVLGICWCPLKFCRDRIVELQKNPTAPGSLPTVFDTMLNPNLEKGQYTPTLQELTGDALLLLMAGTDSTAHTLVTATYGMLTHPDMLRKLKTELKEAIPDRDSFVEWAVLEKLPYLRAVIKESLRYVSGSPGRLPRTVPSTGAVFCGWQIPPGTIITSGTYVHHRNPKVFEDPNTFRPERWLQGSVGDMEKNLVSFSRGSRTCTGMK